MSLEIRFLPARQGDAIWIRWGAGRSLSHQVLIDMGTEEIGHAIRDRLEGLAEDERRFELLVVTHVDRDHIGGVLTALAETAAPLPGLGFEDVWFNGWEHLAGRVVPSPQASGAIEGMGPAQGERLAQWLRNQRWNEKFGRGPAVRPQSGTRVIPFAAGLSLTLLGPPQSRLEELRPTWKEEVEVALARGRLDRVSPGLEAYGSRVRPDLQTREDLEELADSPTSADSSKANGSSIALLLEWEGRRILLAGDAFADDLISGLRPLGAAPLPVDAFKLPHHGSKQNVTDALVRAVDCPRWIFSTDGTQFRHPDAIAVARVLRSRVRSGPRLCFNVPSTYNRWWDDPDWRSRFGYEVEYGTAADGLELRLEAG